jgi:hypothetical protein
MLIFLSSQNGKKSYDAKVTALNCENRRKYRYEKVMIENSAFLSDSKTHF